MRRSYWMGFPFLILMVLFFFFWKGLGMNPRALPSTRIGQSLPVFQLPDLLNDTAIFRSDAIKASPYVVLNVWASWCPACLEEHAFLVSLAKKGNLIYGLNYKDTLSAARVWLSKQGNPYQAVGFDQKGQAAIDLGVYGAPETFLINKDGRIVFRYAGILNEEVWDTLFLPQINRL